MYLRLEIYGVILGMYLLDFMEVLLMVFFLVKKQEHHLPKAGGIFAKKSIRGIE